MKQSPMRRYTGVGSSLYSVLAEGEWDIKNQWILPCALHRMGITKLATC
jgi:hypothetical protein